MTLVGLETALDLRVNAGVECSGGKVCDTDWAGLHHSSRERAKCTIVSWNLRGGLYKSGNPAVNRNETDPMLR